MYHQYQHYYVIQLGCSWQALKSYLRNDLHEGG